MNDNGSAFLDLPGVVTLSWDSGSQSVLVTWTGHPAPDDFRTLLDAELAAVQRHHTANLLVDCRRQPLLADADQDIGDQEWVPRVIAAGLRRFAVVPPEDRVASIQLMDRLNAINRPELEIRFFFEVEAARAWLRAAAAQTPT